jgi:hypothetical protein
MNYIYSLHRNALKNGCTRVIINGIAVPKDKFLKESRYVNIISNFISTFGMTPHIMS